MGEEKYFVFYYRDDMFIKYHSLDKVIKDIEKATHKNGANRGDIYVVKGRELEHITEAAKVTIKEDEGK